MTSKTDVDHAGLARLLEVAWQTRRPLPPLTEARGLSTLDDAYLIQSEWAALRQAAGDTIRGRKIGLTSRVVQEQMGVDEPDFGNLWASRHVQVVAGRASVPADWFLQPRIEAEFAFLLGSSLPQGQVTGEDVLAATEAVAPSFEIVDSRIEDWRIAIQDTVADNASFGAFVVADWESGLDPASLDTVLMSIIQNGKSVAEGAGAAALGHPANAVAWLVNRLRSFGTELLPGDTVLSGSVARMIPAASGDSFALEIAGERVLSVTFT